MTWDINTLLLHLPFGFFTLWIFGSRGSVTISVDPAWRVKRTLFMTGMIGSLLLGAPLTLFITIPTLLLASTPQLIGPNQVTTILLVIAGPCLIGLYIMGLLAGGKFHFWLRVVKVSPTFMWIRGVHPYSLSGVPPWQLSPFVAAERPIPVFGRTHLRERIADTDPFAELQAPHVAARAALLLSLWGIPCVLGFLVVTVLLGCGGDMGPRSEWRICAFGFGFGLVSLSALWAVLGPFRLFTRVPLAILMAILAISSLALFMLLMERGRRNEGLLLAAGAGVLQWLGLVILLVGARLVFGSKIAIPGTRRLFGNQRAQFGIRQLLIWTTGIALTLGVLRIVAGQMGLSMINWNFLANEAMAFGIVLTFNLILALSLVWGLLTPRGVIVRTAIAVLIIGVATWAEPYAFAFLPPGRPPVAIFLWINGAGSLCLVINLVIVRLCGYRRVPDVR